MSSVRRTTEVSGRSRRLWLPSLLASAAPMLFVLAPAWGAEEPGLLGPAEQREGRSATGEEEHVVLDPSEKSPVRLNGPTILKFRSSAFSNQIVPITERNETVPKSQFGILYNEGPGDVQFVEERWASIDLQHRAKPTGFLRLKYDILKGQNGWRLNLVGADWTRFKDGFLVVGVRPGVSSSPGFKLELKTGEAEDAHDAHVRLNEQDVRLAEQLGYAPVAVPLAEFGIRDFSQLAELRLIIGCDEPFAENTNGELWIESIRLVGTLQELKSLRQPFLLDDLAQLGFEWFQHNRHPATGMVLDRSPNWPGRRERSRMSSIASTGYHLSLLPEWVRLNWLTRDEAEQQARQAIDFAAAKLEHHKGLFYHFVDWETGQRWESCEVSCLDSAILLNGCIVAGEFFKGPIKEASDALVNRAEWNAFLVKHPRTGKALLSWGWTPEKGLLGPADVRSSEVAMPYFLAIGARSHSIDPRCWYNTDVVYGEVGNIRILNPAHPLFTSFYGLGWHHLDAKVDRDGVDLFGNARSAASANRAFCRENAGVATTFEVTNGGWWGISAGDAPTGYIAAVPVSGTLDGTVWPLAALATVPWIPQTVEADLLAWRKSDLWHKACGDFGLSPFNLGRDGSQRGGYWVGPDLIGIDVGSFCLSLANHRAATAWRLWMKHESAAAAMERLRIAPLPGR